MPTGLKQRVLDVQSKVQSKVFKRRSGSTSAGSDGPAAAVNQQNQQNQQKGALSSRRSHREVVGGERRARRSPSIRSLASSYRRLMDHQHHPTRHDNSHNNSQHQHQHQHQNNHHYQEDQRPPTSTTAVTTPSEIDEKDEYKKKHLLAAGTGTDAFLPAATVSPPTPPGAVVGVVGDQPSPSPAPAPAPAQSPAPTPGASPPHLTSPDALQTRDPDLPRLGTTACQHHQHHQHHQPHHHPSSPPSPLHPILIPHCTRIQSPNDTPQSDTSPIGLSPLSPPLPATPDDDTPPGSPTSPPSRSTAYAATPPSPPPPPQTTRKLSFPPKLDPQTQLHLSSICNRRPSQIVRKQSLLPAAQSTLIHHLLSPDKPYKVDEEDEESEQVEYVVGGARRAPPMPVMAKRKIWVKRGATGSATAINVSEDDLVDDARDVILKKFNNSLSKIYDAPDITLFFPQRSGRNTQRERLLSPDEILVRAIDEYFPKGQNADDALIIEVPRRTPRPSPGPGSFPGYIVSADEQDYFTPLPGNASTQGGTPGGSSKSGAPNSMAIVNTVHTPHIANTPSSPRGAPRQYQRDGQRRPQPDRRATATPILSQTPPANTPNSGPIVLAGVSRSGKQRHQQQQQQQQQQQPLPISDTPAPAQPSPVPLIENSNETPDPAPEPKDSITPAPPRVSSPPVPKLNRHHNKKVKKELQKQTPSTPSPSAGMHVDGAVPPIKVLIVEDNIINLRLLEAFMRRLKVRWESAVNGRIAVDKWRAGGFHLVLMDIQLPVMNGLEATKEIRRLERVNRIGAFPHTKLLDGDKEEELLLPEEIPEEDKLPDSVLLRSPVIIVALTASSLQSDRHEAYAAGCNDFLTKPVNFIWLERKVTEWGCMQALIDFDGWKTWCENPSGQIGTDKKEKLSTRVNNRLALPPATGSIGSGKKSPGA